MIADEVVVGPWECRSNDCDAMAEYYVSMPERYKVISSKGRRKIDPWTGHFCLRHLIRVLEVKLPEIDTACLKIRRIV